MIHCLLVSGIPLNDPIRNLLFDTAQQMFYNKTERQNVSSKWCEGYITTQWKTSGVGTIFGTEFKAQMDTNWGTVTVSYVVRESDLCSEDLVWVSPEEHLPTFSKN